MGALGIRKSFAAALFTALLPTTASAVTEAELLDSFRSQGLTVAATEKRTFNEFGADTRGMLAELGAKPTTPVLVVVVQLPCTGAEAMTGVVVAPIGLPDDRVVFLSVGPTPCAGGMPL